jgi:hypothetical protein
METIRYLTITVGTFLILQTLLVIMHEFTHSTTAWLLGDMKSPFGIVWGNPLMMTHWDEGVGYKQLFATGHSIEGAIIGISPCVLHAVIVILGLVFMQTQWLNDRKWLFHVIFWFIVANFMELVAYVLMRAFASHGDIGNFNHGLGLSPWIVFIFGSLALLAGLFFFYRRILPRANNIFAQGNRYLEWSILILSSFIMFLWGSGIRVMAYVTGPQWMFGLLGVFFFILVLFLFRPNRKV